MTGTGDDLVERLRATERREPGGEEEPEDGELRPCPFCGADAERVDFEPPDVDENDENFGGSCIQCKRCNASTAVVFGYKQTLYSSWNERALSALPPPASTTEESKVSVTVTLGEAVFAFRDKQEWINRGPRPWKAYHVDGGRGLAIDAKGRICQCGAHFMRAEEDGSYPITVYRVQADDPNNGAEPDIARAFAPPATSKEGEAGQ